VVLVEASRELGGRAAAEAHLPGLAAWRRVVDYRQREIDALDGVEYYFESAMTADEILEYGFTHIAVATGSHWRRDGVGHWHRRPIPIEGGAELLTPDDLLAGTRPHGRRLIIFDDDHYYLGGVLAELLAGEGYDVALVTPAADISNWTHHTLEQHRIQQRLLNRGVDLYPQRTVIRVSGTEVVTACVFTGREEAISCDGSVFVTSRLPNEAIYLELLDRRERWAGAHLRSVRAIGDAFCPGTIASAVWDGRRFAEELDGRNEAAIFRRNVPMIPA
jgi:dimethylamine/trimethylamine dehydrogenase